MKSKDVLNTVVALATVATCAFWALPGIAAPVVQGGVGDGGGNVSKSRPFSDLERTLEKVKLPVRLAYQFIESTKNVKGNAMRESIWRKLFQGPRTVYQVLNDIEFEVVENDACYYKKEAKDASVTNARQICVSKQRLYAELKEDIAYRKMVLLIAHEVSHILGVDEDEALDIEEMFSEVTNNALFKAESLQGSMKENLRTIRDNIDSLKVVPKAMRCAVTSLITEQARALFEGDSANEYGMSVLNKDQISKAWLVFIKSTNLHSPCLNYTTVAGRVEDVYGNAKEISAAQFLETMFKGFPFQPWAYAELYKATQVRRLDKKGAKAAARIEENELRDLAVSILETVPGP